MALQFTLHSKLLNIHALSAYTFMLFALCYFNGKISSLYPQFGRSSMSWDVSVFFSLEFFFTDWYEPDFHASNFFFALFSSLMNIHEMEECTAVFEWAHVRCKQTLAAHMCVM